MHLARSFCVLCGEHILKVKYNLKTTNSEISETQLIQFVEKMYDNISLMHCNICSDCYELLNELDSVQVRAEEITEQLKSQIAKNRKVPKKKGKKSHEKSKSPGKKKLNDDVSDQSDYGGNDNECIEIKHEIKEEIMEDVKVKDEIVNKIKKEGIDLTKLPIKVKRVVKKGPKKSEKGKLKSKEEEVSDVDDQMDNSFNFSPTVSDNEEAFEKVQSLIQMDLSKHLEQHKAAQPKKSKNVLCDICGANFKSKMGFTNHMKKHGSAEDETNLLELNKPPQNWECHQCGKIFEQRAKLIRHVAIHSGETRYQCDLCGKRFVHHSSFRMHKLIHEGKRDYTCTECGKKFLTSSHLGRHMRAAHTKKKEHTCTLCGKSFAEKYNLNAHMKYHINSNTVDYKNEAVDYKNFKTDELNVVPEVLDYKTYKPDNW